MAPFEVGSAKRLIELPDCFDELKMIWRACDRARLADAINIPADSFTAAFVDSNDFNVVWLSSGVRSYDPNCISPCEKL